MRDNENSFTSIIQVVENKAKYLGEHVAFRFDQGDSSILDLTYAQLSIQAKRIGKELTNRNLCQGRILLLLPSGPDYVASFLGCLFVGAVPVPNYAPRSRNLAAVQKAITEDCGATGIIASKAIAERLADLTTDLDNEAIIWADDISSPYTSTPVLQCITPKGEDTAYIQYTSGSTRSPRGVEITHGNLCHNLKQLSAIINAQPNDHIVSWLPPFHDMGLVGGILTPLYAGIPATLIVPNRVVRRPFRWLEILNRHKGTITVAPNFAFDMCAASVTEDQKDGLDLSKLRLIFVGAEPIKLETLERFADSFESCGLKKSSFYPCYGLAEVTLIAAGGKPGTEPFVRSFDKNALENHRVVPGSGIRSRNVHLVACGTPISDLEIEIVDPNNHQRSENSSIGEIWIAGPSVARSYWGKLSETQTTFRGVIKPNNEGPYLRTGDLGFFFDGQLFITGRLKDLIIIRGRNLYPHDLEGCAADSYPGLIRNGAVAYSVESDFSEGYTVVQEVKVGEPKDYPQMLSSIRSALVEEFGVEPASIIIVKRGAVPKTSSGKVRRAKTKQLISEGKLTILAQHSLNTDKCDRVPKSVAEVAGILQLEMAKYLGKSPGSIELELTMHEINLDSLGAMRLANTIESKYGVALQNAMFSYLSQGQTLLEVAEKLFEFLNSERKIDLKRNEELEELVQNLSADEIEQILRRLNQTSDT